VYTYNDRLLVRSNTRLSYPETRDADAKTENYCTDYYRYSRSGSLRSVERVYHTAGADTRTRLAVPNLILDAAKTSGFVNPGAAYSSDFFQDILTDTLSRVVYTTDARGRVLTETRRGEAGLVIGELWNTWSGDRLAAVHWVSGDDDRRTEYEYDNSGDRIVERNYNRGVLERVVRREGDREV
jgi:hypothetical protein